MFGLKMEMENYLAGHGIDFSATGNGSGTMSSELLDDYEEGTFYTRSSIWWNKS